MLKFAKSLASKLLPVILSLSLGSVSCSNISSNPPLVSSSSQRTQKQSKLEQIISKESQLKSWQREYLAERKISFEKIKPYLSEGFSFTDSSIFLMNNMNIDKIKPYKQLNIEPWNIIVLARENIPPEIAKTFLERGYDADDTQYLVHSKIPLIEADPYKNQKFKGYEIAELIKNKVSIQTAKHLQEIGYSGLDIPWLVKYNLEPKQTLKYKQTGINRYGWAAALKNNLKPEDIEKYKGKGFTPDEASFLLIYKVPLEFALSKKTEFDVLDICALYPSALRNSKISPKTTEQIYQDNIFYSDFNKLQINDSSSTLQISVPKDLALFLIQPINSPEIKDKEKFSHLVLEEAEKLKYSQEKIKTLSPKSAIKLAVDITSRRISYFDVDRDKDFIVKHGEHLSSDKYFEIGLGDCDKYQKITQAVFDIFREINPGLQNVYLTSSRLGGKTDIQHAWNTVVYLNTDRIYYSQIDPTFYDSTKKLEAGSFHLDKANFRENFYKSITKEKVSK